MKLFQVIASLFLVMTAVAMGGVPPKPSEFNCVFDYGGMLQSDETQLIQIAGNYIRAKSKAELVVVTVENLDGMVLEDYATELFNTWGIGDKEKNNGVLLLVNKETTLAGTSGRVRIEVGYGLEGALPDSVCGRILDEKTLPAWDKKEYGRGIVEGYMEIVRRTAMEYSLDMPQELMDACNMEPLWCDVVERPGDVGYVYDIAKVLDDEKRQAMEAICTEMQSQANVQFYVVAVDCGGEDLKLYARSLIRAWGLPMDEETNMALLLFDAGRTDEAKPEHAMLLMGSKSIQKNYTVMDAVYSSASSYIGGRWRKKLYGDCLYRVYLHTAELVGNAFELKLSKENKAFFSEIHPWYEKVLGGILGLFLCLGIPFLVIRHFIDLFSGLGSASSSGGYSSSSSSSRSSSYSSHSSGGGGFGGGRSGGGGASR